MRRDRVGIIRLLCSVVVLGVPWPCGLSAADMVDLRGPAPEVGQVIHTFTDIVFKGHVLSPDGSKIIGAFTASGLKEDEFTVLEVQDREVSKFQTRNIMDEMTWVRTAAGGESRREDKPNALAGTIVVSEKSNGVWKHSLVGSTPTADQLTALTSEKSGWADTDTPDGRHLPGKTWETDNLCQVKEWARHFTEVTGTGKQTFLKVEEFSGEQCAVIEGEGHFKFRLPADSSSQTQGVDLSISKSLTYRSLRLGLDLKTTGDGSVRVTDADKVVEGKFRFEEVSKLKE